MLTTDQISTLLDDGTVIGGDGSKIGKIAQVYVANDSGRPEWLTVKTGMFGGAAAFVPLAEADADGSQLRVPYDKKTIKDAPQVDSYEHPSPQEEQRDCPLLPDWRRRCRGDQQRADRSSAPGAVGRNTSGPTTDDVTMRSEERLAVGTQTRESGRARLRKYVVTEEVARTVPVKRVRTETDTITGEEQVNEQVRKEQIEADEGRVDPAERGRE